MKLIRNIDTKIVSYMLANTAEITLVSELIADGMKALDITSDTHEIVTGVAAPSVFVGGALAFDGEWKVINQELFEKAKATDDTDFERLKLAKNIDINTWREKANFKTFTHLGKEISCDRVSRSDIDGVAGYISLFSTFPPDFPGVWKTTDNDYIEMPTIESFKEMFQSMIAAGGINFLRSEQLKGALKLAKKIADLDAIIWE